MEGTIEKLTDRGYGFITVEGDTKGIFFHGNDIVGAEFNNLNEGDKVTFEKEASDKGPKAVKVTLV